MAGCVDYQTFVLTPEKLDEIWPQLRPIDREECRHMGYHDGNYQEIIKQADKAYYGEIEGKVVIMWGHVVSQAFMNFWFLATPEAEKYWKTATKAAKGYIEGVRMEPQYYCLRKTCLIWEGHQGSLRWAGVLGFRHRIMDIPLIGGTKMILLEHRAK